MTACADVAVGVVGDVVGHGEAVVERVRMSQPGRRAAHSDCAQREGTRR